MGEDTLVDERLMRPLAIGGREAGYLIAIVASMTFHRATRAIVHSLVSLGLERRTHLLPEHQLLPSSFVLLFVLVNIHLHTIQFLA
jgi:hypothetical protein